VLEVFYHPHLLFRSIRCVHTAQLIALDLRRSKVRIEEGLTEWQIPSLLVDLTGTKTSPQKPEKLAQVYGTIDTTYQSVNPHAPDDSVDVPEGAPHFQETEEALLLRCATTLTRILEHSNGESLAIVSHAPCDQALALYLEAKVVSDSKLGPWPLGGITMFSRVVNDNTTCSQNYSYGEWELECYGNTDHMPGKYKAGLKVCVR
jgi:broad specificity phosphatase PhoE